VKRRSKRPEVSDTRWTPGGDRVDVGASRCDHGIPLRGPPHDRGLGPVSAPACPCLPRRHANASPARIATRCPVLTRRPCVAFAPGSMVPRIPCPARAACSTTWSPSVRYPVQCATANALLHRAAAHVVEQCAMCPSNYARALHAVASRSCRPR